jgi:hypothetical protein
MDFLLLQVSLVPGETDIYVLLGASREHGDGFEHLHPVHILGLLQVLQIDHFNAIHLSQSVANISHERIAHLVLRE